MRPKKRVDRFATGTLQKLDCATCAEPTVHRHGRCIHCKGVNAQSVEAHEKRGRTRLHNRMPVKA